MCLQNCAQRWQAERWQKKKGGTSAEGDKDHGASSDASTASQRLSRTKLFCTACYDAHNARPINFHAECFNAWHGLCHEATEE